MIIFQSPPASYYKSRDEFTLQICDSEIYVLQRKQNDRQLLRKFSNLDYKHLLLCIKKGSRCNNNISLRNCSYTAEGALQL